MATIKSPTSRQALFQTTYGDLRLSYIEAQAEQSHKGTLLLIHGFPESSHQFRQVIGPLAKAGYRVIAPDYRGHGFSSKPATAADWTKRELAGELHRLVTESLGIAEKIHVVGHDIGGMIAHAYVAQFPEGVSSVIWGECPLPGTSYYDEARSSGEHWHFDFHARDPAVACALVAGKERTYIQHFFDKLSWNHAALSSPDPLDFYVARYSAPDAMCCAFLTYRAFEEDAEDNRRWLAENGRVKVRSLVLSGEGSWAAGVSGPMAREMYADVKEGIVGDCGHYIAEENPDGFLNAVLGFIDVN